jgi:uncharacterized repeat protein (TIGR01451 family)
MIVNKRFGVLGLSALTALTLVPFGGNAPLLAQAVNASKTVVSDLLNRPSVKLQLAVEKKVAIKDAQGQTKVSWQALNNGAEVESGNVLRYTVKGVNEGNRAAKNLTVVQPVPQGLSYVLNSATASAGAPETTFSIDGGKTFAAKPTIAVTLPNGQIEYRPAPVTAYSNVRWTFSQPINPKATTVLAYQVSVK